MSPFRAPRAVRPLAGIFGLCAAAVLGGCVTHEPLSAQYPGPQELPAALAERFDYESTRGARAGEADTRKRLRFTVREITLPAANRGEPLTIEYYDHDSSERRPVVLVLPIFNGNPLVTRYFARYFAQRGWAAVAVDMKRDMLDRMADLEHAIRETLVDYRRVLDWVMTNPEVDPESVGVFGISFGGIDAVMLAALDDRIDALVAGMAGGDLPYIAAHTRYRPVFRAVDDMLEDTGQDRRDLEDRLDAMLDTDPLLLAPYVDAERALLVLTRTDAIVPFEAQQELRLSMGNPEALYLPTGHRTSVVYFPKLRSTAYDFFARQFGETEAGLPN